MCLAVRLKSLALDYVSLILTLLNAHGYQNQDRDQIL